MTDSLKWVVTGASFALLVGAFFAGQHYSRSGQSETNIVSTQGPSEYPAPEISIVAHAMGNRGRATLLSRSSGLYADNVSIGRRRRPRRQKPAPEPKKEESQVGEIDREMGYMSVDEKKLREAMDKADRAEQTGDTNPPQISGESGR